MAVVCSAPGKVLLAGGYLILDRPHAGTVRKLFGSTLGSPSSHPHAFPFNRSPLPCAQVLALDARFFSGIEIIAISDDPQALAASETGLIIEVHSPQFRDERRYAYRWGDSADAASLELLPRGDAPPPSPNKYVEIPLLYGLTLLRHTQPADDDRAFLDGFVERCLSAGHLEGINWADATIGLRITLAADNGFYSQADELKARSLPMSAASLRSLPPMLPPRTDRLGEIAKTGLGSSATLVTSLLGALLHAFGSIELPSKESVKDGALPAATGALKGDAALSLLHSLAQLCHCTAQGKVGSGFDVCVATYGSQRYTRFSPDILKDLLSLPSNQPPPGPSLTRCVGLADYVRVWDHNVSAFQLPPGIEVLMADVSCGANTPSMVKKVTAWRKAGGAKADALWKQYAASSEALQAGLQQICAVHARARKTAATLDKLRSPSPTTGGASSRSTGPESPSGKDAGWAKMLSRCGCADVSDWPSMGALGEALTRVRSSCLEMRTHLREISKEAQTPIEPPEQTALLDATMKVRGVLMAVVPGAGGNDAVLALILPSVPPPPSDASSSTLAASSSSGSSGSLRSSGIGAAASPKASGALTTEGTRAAVAEVWRAWPTVAPKPAPSVVCELSVTESRASTDNHNGVLLEGKDAAATLKAARETPSERAPPAAASGLTTLPRRLLRILTQSELEAQQIRRARWEVLQVVTIVAAAAVVVASARRLFR